MTAPLEFTLPDRIAVLEDSALLSFLRTNPDRAVDISASRLRRLDTLLVQALIAAAADRRARCVALRLTGVGADQAAQLAALGVTEAHLQVEVAG